MNVGHSPSVIAHRNRVAEDIHEASTVLDKHYGTLIKGLRALPETDEVRHARDDINAFLNR